MVIDNINSRNIAHACKQLQELDAWVQLEWDRLYPAFPNPTIVQTFRGENVQKVLFMQGRKSLAEVNLARQEIGMPRILAVDNKIITKLSGGSKHNTYPSKAIDYLFIEGRTILSAKNSEKYYELLNEIAKKFNPSIRWGGDWNADGKKNEKFIDMPHFEI